MNEIEKAIAELQNRAGRTLKTALSAEVAGFAVEALQEKTKRDKMLCVSCKHEPKNPTSATLPCSMCFVAYASYFEPKENENG